MGYFEGVIGQDKNKKTLGFYVDFHKKFKAIPHFCFVAQKGDGKTMLATRFSKHLYEESSQKKNFAPAFNAANVKNVDDFWANIVLPFVDSNDEYSILIDEASELPRDVMFMLLTALQPNNDNRNTITHDGVSVDVDFRKTTFLFATTDPQRLTNAFKSRLKMITLQQYDKNELKGIIEGQLKNNNISFTDQSLDKIVSYVRTNGRAATLMGKDIVDYCKLFNKSNFDISSCEGLIDIHNLKPYGVTENDIQILRALSNKSHLKLMDLEAITGLESQAIRLEFESNLIKNGLMGRESKGRYLTNKGKEFLKKYGN